MEKVILKTRKRFIDVNNPFGEKSRDYTDDNIFVFEKGKIYGVICEHGGGGEAISLLLSNQVARKEEKIYFDDVEVDDCELLQAGWYIGKAIYSGKILRKEASIKKALKYAVNKYQKYNSVHDIVEEFKLSSDILDYGLSKNCHWVKWRASLAIGYASNKIIYCFPWMNTLEFYDCLYNSSVFRMFKKMRNEGLIIILPTSRRENVTGLVDEVIQIHTPRFEQILSDTQYFREYF